MPKPHRPPEVEQLGELGELISLSRSNTLRALLAKRKEYWQGQVNIFVKQKDITEAYGAWCRFNDIDKFMELIEQRIEELKKGGS